MDATLTQLVYVSAATASFSGAGVNALLRHARHANCARGIGGCLLYEADSFLQLLEGPRSGVEALYNRIARDPRHTDVMVLHSQPIPERQFGDWKMGFFPDARRYVETVPGFDDFFSLSGFTGLTASDERLPFLLDALRSGQWHAHLR